ncbi:MAG: class I SAM-dependent methyltransferase [Acidimicrobiales bacterium]
MADGADGDAWFELNRAWWDERVATHVASDFYGVEAFLHEDWSPLRRYEVEEAGDVTGLDLVHLQCHFGLDTLAWARLGARVVGVDLSTAAVEAARAIAERAGLDAEFVAANVYDAPAAVGGRTFDRVYTGIGALTWLPDIDAWARTVGALLRPGGRLHLVEFHPVTHWCLADDDLTVANSYFHEGPWVWGAEASGGSYAEAEATFDHNETVEWNHGLGAVVTALADAGLRIQSLVERPTMFVQRWASMVEHGHQDWRLPADQPQIPLSYSLLAVKPTEGRLQA